VAKQLPKLLNDLDLGQREYVKNTINQLAQNAAESGELPHPGRIADELRRRGLVDITGNAVHMILYRAGIAHVGCPTINPEVAARAAVSGKPATGGNHIDQAGQIEYLRSQLRESRSQASSALRRVGRQEELYRALRQEVKALQPAPKNFELRSHEGRPHVQECLAQIACLHVGEIVSPEKTYGLGDYDLAMAQARVQTYVDSVLDLAINHHSGETFTRLWVVCLGDTVNGTIHKELERSQEFGVARQTVEAGNLLALMLRDFASYFPEVVFIGYPGNHGRIHKEPSFIDKTDSYDNLAYALAKERVRDIPNVEVRIPESFFTIEEINTRRFLFTHGDMIRAWAGIPWYGKDRARANLADLVKRHGLDFEYFGLSHFHTNMMVQETYGETLFTGSSKGPCGFSIGTKGVGSDPVWWFYGVHAKRGVSFRYPVNMKWASREEHVRYQV